MVRVCRWGILSTAEIGQKNWQAIVNSENATITAVASRDVSKSQAFIDRCMAAKPVVGPVPKAYGSYEALLADDQVDAVYIPLPTGLRRQWVIAAAEAGKHVLCEKPCATNAIELREMIEACERNKVQFMDGVMYMHTRRLEQLREAIDDGETVGDIKRIGMQFSFNGGQEFLEGNIRTDATLEPQGCLGDLGWYTIRFALWAKNFEVPARVSGRILSSIHRDESPAPTPLEFSGELFFADGSTASFYNSFVTEMQQWAVISGTKGLIRVDDFVLPYMGNSLDYTVSKASFEVTDCDFVMEKHDTSVQVPEYANSHVTAQETNLFRNFSNLVLEGKPESFWPEISLKTQEVLDACFDSACHDGAVRELFV